MQGKKGPASGGEAQYDPEFYTILDYLAEPCKSPLLCFYIKCFELSTSQRNKSVNPVGGRHFADQLPLPLFCNSSIRCKSSSRPSQAQAKKSTPPSTGGVCLQELRAHGLDWSVL